MSRALVPLLAVALGACPDNTEIVVSIATNLEIPKQLSEFDFDVYNTPMPDAGGFGVIHVTSNVDPQAPLAVTLPGTIGLFPQGDPSRSITIAVTGRSGGDETPHIWRRARVPFSKDAIILVRMNLLKSCIDVKCLPGFSCKEDGCQPDDEKGVPYTPGFAPFLERGPARLDGRPDQRRDLGPGDGAPDRAADFTPPVERTLDRRPVDRKPVDAPQDAPVKKDGRPADRHAADGPLVDRTVADKPADTPLVMDKPLTVDKPLVMDKPLTVDKPIANEALADKPAYVCPTSASCASNVCVIPAGSFTMGSPSTEICRDVDEGQHQVTLTRCFEIGQYEVTEGEWVAAFGSGSDPSYNKAGNNYPVEQVTWHMAAAYCNWLSTKNNLTTCFDCTGPAVPAAGLTSCKLKDVYALDPYWCPGYRLPTDAEWEYAIRANTTTALHNNHDLMISSGQCKIPVQDTWAEQIAWYNDGTVIPPAVPAKHPVGQKLANLWQLYDMAGNVSEWVLDGYTFVAPDGGPPPAPPAATDPYQPVVDNSNCSSQGTKMASVRGGRFTYEVAAVRSGNRANKCVNLVDGGYGFRWARSLTKLYP